MIDPAAARWTAIAAFPDMAALDVVVHDGGWDSVALEFGGTWICKFPRDEDGHDALRIEAALLAVLRPMLTIAVPDMTFVAAPVLFTRHRKIVGQAVTSELYRGMAVARRVSLAYDIAGFLAELHAVSADWSAIGIEADDADDDASIAALAGIELLAADLRPAAERALADHAALGPDPLGVGLCYLDAHGNNFAFDARAAPERHL